MEEERLKTWLGFVQFMVGTVVLGAVSTHVNQQIQNREVEIKEQEANGAFLAQAVQEDVGVRRRLSQYFATVTRSAEVRERWRAYSDLVEVEYQAKLAEKKALEEKIPAAKTDPKELSVLLGQLNQVEKELDPMPQAARSQVAPRVYVHIQNENQRARAAALADLLRENETIVPGIERLDVGPNSNELRYFRTSEKAEAEAIVALLRATGVPMDAKYVAGHENSTRIRPRHFELWFSASPIP